MACGILVPRPGIEPTPPALEVQGLICWTTREVPEATVSENVYSSCKVINLISNYNSWENALFCKSKCPLPLYVFLIFSSTEFINIGCLMEKKTIWRKSCIYLQYVTCWFDTHIYSVQFSRSVVSDSLWPHESQHTRPPCPSPTPGIHSDSRPWSQWCHPAVSSSIVPFSSCPQSLPTSESFPMSQLFKWGDQSTGVSALALFLPKKSQGWSPSEYV